jgi:DNA ligase (NAD+)
METEFNFAKLNNNTEKYLKKLSINDIVKLLKYLSQNYYNSPDALVSDDVYDYILEYLKNLDPTNNYFNVIGYEDKDAIKLPYFMPSLNKIKPEIQSNVKQFDNWINKYKGPYVISDKLDGVSGLIVKNNNEINLYTREEMVKKELKKHIY